MLHSDDASSMTGLGIARALEDAMIQFVPHARPGPRLQFDVESIRSRAKMISRVVTDYQDLVHARKTLDRIVNRSPELIESGWAALLSNKANLEEFAGVHPEDTYLETRKIFLPQGATLILHYWQREWNEFLTKLERVSTAVPTRGSHWATKDYTDVTQVSLDPPLVTVQKVSHQDNALIHTTNTFRLFPPGFTICLESLSQDLASLTILKSRHIRIFRHQ